ncbi:MAG: tyrosine-type recombinase/integrase [Elusimicrobia bacterium]|nr:tyrosine-type recombinase/integrase [Elusimicrobiota bacterium]
MAKIAPKTLAFRPAGHFEVTLGSASEAFRLRCQAQNLSPATIGWYRQLLKLFAAFLESQGVSAARGVTPTLLRQYLEHMRERGNGSVTVERAYGGLRCFFGFLSRERMIPQNPIQLVEKPRVERKLIKPLSLEQVRLLLAQCNQKRYDEHRLWTIMVLIFDTGLRISEVIGLRKDAIDFNTGVLRVMGKGGKERDVPFGINSKRALWGYLARRGDIPGQDLFFVSRFGGRCCRYLLRKEFHRLGEQAGIQGVRVSPHTMRHTFATQYILNGGDAFSLQQILGHSTLDMVKIYVGLANRDVAKLHRQFSPMDRMGIVPGGKRRVIVR